MPDPLGDFAYTWPFYLSGLLGYLLGSIPFGLVLTRLAGYGDIRKIGSGNIGATNVLRTGNKVLAAATVLLDGGKGALAAYLGFRFGPDMAVIAGTAAVVGHLFPIWLRFRGGKGVATTLGVFLGLNPAVGALACAAWLAAFALTRISSLGSIVSLAVLPVLAYFVADRQTTEVAGLLAVLLIARHHANIRRLLRGEEPHIGRS
ncbi:MAG: glycerol-3-phosphate 1-O-acyltransferase [Alphaproteobacteria bacterium]|nr:glycerol-3-phosphate 1-O-acyltransferase [Alphaproteobacteria bacterium]